MHAKTPIIFTKVIPDINIDMKRYISNITATSLNMRSSHMKTLTISLERLDCPMANKRAKLA